MSLLQKLIERARKTPGKKIVFPEGNDPRVVLAAERIAEEGIAVPILLGTEAEIDRVSAEDGIDDKKFHAFDHLKSEMLDRFASEFCLFRKRKNMTHEKGLEIVRNRLFFGAMMVRHGFADGMVAGSLASTAETLRAAITVIGLKEGVKTLSGSFFMDLKTPTAFGGKVLLFADCGVNPNPDSEQLAEIAVLSAGHFRFICGEKPRIAFLSFSTHGSAGDDSISKIRNAIPMTMEKLRASGIEADVDGELQADSALVSEVAKRKCKNEVIEGNANVLIFPDLNSGNISYKLVERLAGASAYGPILQGLAKPVNDLSRGCSVDDIVGVSAITVCQCG
ncbi:MAG TPA: phosphate acetyltransferase [Lentisphaeria bacterium]|nr:MAG: phosphate acetyltransferase [Lentisphaerae bacterium GWF2_50_93]HCE42606.1 phosphate acetyltransferase [Lentisphaeria bacterium]